MSDWLSNNITGWILWINFIRGASWSSHFLLLQTVCNTPERRLTFRNRHTVQAFALFLPLFSNLHIKHAHFYVYYFHKQHRLTHYGETVGAFMNCVNVFVFKSGSSKGLKREVRNNNYVQSSQKKKEWITERETTAKSQESPLKTWKRPKRAANKMKTKKTERQNDHKWDTQHDVKQLKGDNHKETHSYCKKDAKWPQKNIQNDHNKLQNSYGKTQNDDKELQNVHKKMLMSPTVCVQGPIVS